MALVFGDSFDHYAFADILKKWSSQVNISGSIMNVGNAIPGHGQCLQMIGITGLGGLTRQLAARITPTFIAGGWFRWDGVTTAQIIMQGLDGATEHVSVRMDATSHITFTRNATVLATSTNTLSSNTWYHIEIRVTIGDAGDTPSGRYEVKVNGSSVNWIPDSGTGQDTRNAGTIGITAFVLSSTNGRTVYLQDVYLLDTTGTQASDFLGPCSFIIVRPTGAGNSAQWTGNYADNWQNVADPTGDGDGTFNQSSTAGHIDLFEGGNVPAGTIHAIQHVILAKKDAGAARTIRPKTRIAGTTYSGATVTLTASYLYYTEPVMFSPDTGGATAFTSAEINGAEFGYELVS